MQLSPIVNQGRGESPPRTYIAVTFWGEEYRRYFLDYCLASLMAPNNIPAIQDKENARLLIATRDDDWQAMQSEPIFQAAKQHITVEHVRHEARLNVHYNEKMSVMSQGHKLLARRMFSDRAHGIMVYPDVIFADGAIRRIEELALKGYKVVMCIAVRFSNEGLVDDIKQRGFVPPGNAIVIDPRTLARLTIRHLHSETVRLEFEAGLDDQGACSFFWVVTPGQDLLFHCTNWAPLLLDYTVLGNHDESTFDEWTFDGDYVAKNFSNIDDIYVIQNTDELFVTGFTAESKVAYRLIRPFYYRSTIARRFLKMARAREYMESVKILDAVKKPLFRLPIRVRGGVASEEAWCAAEAKALRIVDGVSNPGVAIRLAAFGLRVARPLLLPAVRSYRRLRAVSARVSNPAGA